jgi:predicted LPLAT superfamily acyltransferase
VGEPSGLGAVYRHVLRFAQVSLDRVFMAKGDFRPFRIAFHGEEHLRAAAASGNGALVVVAHLGSFDVLQALAGERALPVRFLADFRNAPAFNAALKALNPRVDARVIPIRPGDPGFVLEAEEVVRAGHLLGTMGDRVGSDARAVVAPFLGAPARFPAGPWLVAAALGCPVLLAFGLHTPPDRYDLYCEPFAERIALPRRGRDEAVAAWAARYAQRLEAYVRRAPYDWFNFYDFWSTT